MPSTSTSVPHTAGPRKTQSAQPQACDYCASSDLDWVKCKLICRNCRQIVMSCADLSAPE